MCRRRRGGCRMPEWLRDYEARLCSVLAIVSFSCAVTSFAVFTDSAVFSLTVVLKPAVCTVHSVEELSGLTKCHWTSCRGSCTAVFYNCTQIKVSYELTSENQTNITNFNTIQNSEVDEMSNFYHVNYNVTTDVDTAYEANHHFILEDPEIAQLFDGSDEIVKQNTSSDLTHSHNYDATNITHNPPKNTTSTRMTRSTDLDNDNFLKDELEKVNFTDLMANSSENSSVLVPLLVNIFGCGYEPEELCVHFFANYTHVGMEFQCLINQENEIFAIPDPDEYDFTKFKDPMRSLLLSLIPLGVCVFSAFYIRARRLFRMPQTIPYSQVKKKRIQNKTEDTQEKDFNIPTIVESRCSTKMTYHKNGQDNLPAYIKIPSICPEQYTDHPCQVSDREQFL